MLPAGPITDCVPKRDPLFSSTVMMALAFALAFALSVFIVVLALRRLES
jgi:hypothetical protein